MYHQLRKSLLRIFSFRVFGGILKEKSSSSSIFISDPSEAVPITMSAILCLSLSSKSAEDVGNDAVVEEVSRFGGEKGSGISGINRVSKFVLMAARLTIFLNIPGTKMRIKFNYWIIMNDIIIPFRISFS